MQLPTSLRNLLVETLDKYLANFSARPDGEAVSNYVVEELEVWADAEGLEDIIHILVESGGLDTEFTEALESEMTSNDEFEYTGDEVVGLLEQLCAVEWVNDDDFEGADADDEDDLTDDQ